MKSRFKIFFLTLLLSCLTAISSFAYSSYLNSADPLNGLVKEDILVPFRKENWFNPQIEHDTQTEAYQLGAWALYKLQTPSEELILMSTGIGNSYEWVFGTDVANNFQNNFPYYYAYYFALKDYYNSNGRNSYATYANLYDEYYFFNSGNADVAIKQLFSDLQIFITASNNALRVKYKYR